MFDMQFISELLKNVLLAILVPLASAGAAWVVAKLKEQLANVSQQQLDILEQVAIIAVTAAEQAYKDADGPAKKGYALGLVEAQLAKYGLKIDLDEIEAAIESAVYQQFNWKPKY